MNSSNRNSPVIVPALATATGEAGAERKLVSQLIKATTNVAATATHFPISHDSGAGTGSAELTLVQLSMACYSAQLGDTYSIPPLQLANTSQRSSSSSGVSILTG